jgi:hypothetical protein
VSRRWVFQVRLLIWSLLVVGGAIVARAPERAPAWVFAGLATTVWPLWRAWRASQGTALRSAVVWAFLAVGLGLLAQIWAAREPLATGRPAAGHLAYLSALSTLASLMSVLNARRPGSVAWALLMALLVLVFLIPWLEGVGLAGNVEARSRLRLETPWTLFYLLLVVAGVTNYLPTRFGLAAIAVGASLLLEYAGLTRTTWPLERRAVLWSAAPWALAVAIWAADARSRRPEKRPPCMERLWLWFRDRWGAVWAIRVQDRFNRSAEILGWPIRLGWQGVIGAPGQSQATPAVPEAAASAFRGLVRRFADPVRLDAELGPIDSGPCQASEVQ